MGEEVGVDQQRNQGGEVDIGRWGLAVFGGLGLQRGQVQHQQVVLEKAGVVTVLRAQLVRQHLQIGRLQAQRQQGQAGAFDLEGGGAAAGQGNGHGGVKKRRCWQPQPEDGWRATGRS